MIRLAAERTARGDIHNPATAVCLHDLHDLVHEIGRTEQIRLDRLSPRVLPVRVRGLEDRVRRVDGSVVHENVDPAEPLDNGRHERFHGGRLADIGDKADVVRADQRTKRLLGSGGIGAVVDDHVRARAGEPLRNGTSDATRCAGHEYYLVVELGHVTPSECCERAARSAAHCRSWPTSSSTPTSGLPARRPVRFCSSRPT